MVLLHTCCDIEPAGWRTEDECLMISINLYWWVNSSEALKLPSSFMKFVDLKESC
jgi:hypothetical protein